MKESDLEKIQKEIVNLIAQLGTDAVVVLTTTTKEEEEVINVQLETATDQASLIGYHGETLQALQLMLSFLCHKLLDKWVRVVVNVGDYRQKREEQLRKLALNLAMKAKFSREVQTIPSLNASERRFVHLLLTDHPDVYTQSEGDGRQRTLTIKPKV